MDEFGGAVAGGGRYDKMIGKFTGQDTPACGFSIGFERIVMLLLENGYEIPSKRQKKAYLLEKGMHQEGILKVLAMAKEDRANGKQVLIANMKKNKKFQKDQLIATLEVVYRTSVLAEVEVYAMSDVKPADKTGVTIRSAAVEGSKAPSGFLSALGTICVIVLGAAIAYMTFNAYMRTRIRARRKKRRSQRRRSN